MDINKFFKNRFKEVSSYELTQDEQKMLDLGQLEEFIYRKISSQKFRKNKLLPETLKHLREKIKMSIENNQPLYFIFGFGGYKNHWVDRHHPHIGWAEVFNLLHVTEILAPILKVYKPGVIFEYESEGQAVVVGNNYTQEDIDTYTEDFKSLISFAKGKFLPKNLDIRYAVLRDQYSTESLFYRVGKLVPGKMKELSKLPKKELDHMLKRARFNLKMDGREDLTKLNEKEIGQKALESLAHNNVFLDEDFVLREEYFEGGNHIPTVGAYITLEENEGNWITLSSCKRSANAFWTSRGILEEAGEGYVENILGPGKYNEVKDLLTTQETKVFKKVAPGLEAIEVLGKLS